MRRAVVPPSSPRVDASDGSYRHIWLALSASRRFTSHIQKMSRATAAASAEGAIGEGVGQGVGRSNSREEQVCQRMRQEGHHLNTSAFLLKNAAECFETSTEGRWACLWWLLPLYDSTTANFS